ncbi:MAG: class I SAM-dependent methyltransferase [Gammaproteobacteria bacterium]|nr:MAG: class I SAM-dependent methyltransferase [Gammaproteobacteria bacterium]
MKKKNEVQRIRKAYQYRDSSGKAQLYRWDRPEMLLAQYTLYQAVASVMRHAGKVDLASQEILDVGCGKGGWLSRLLDWGARPEKLHGIDLLPDRIEAARRRAPNVDFRVTDGEVPYADQSMDLVCANTVFSSILDAAARMELASEMRRVLKPGGAIMIYDFRISHPRNPDTLGIGKREVRRLFPGMKCCFRSLTLAPPLARVVAPISPWFAYSLERTVPFLRTHGLFHLRNQQLENPMDKRDAT